MNLLLALDDSDCSETALAVLVEQFRPGGTTVRVIHVIEWPHDLPTSPAFAEAPSAVQCVVRAKDEHRRHGHALLDRAVARLQRAHFAATAQLVEGGARQAIVAMAANWPADAIVIGSHGRHGLDRALLGSVSDGVVRHAPCSVHVVRERAIPRTGATQPGLLTTIKREESHHD
jgi:nucleotide-binding universal stress UspA family protein